MSAMLYTHTAEPLKMELKERKRVVAPSFEIPATLPDLVLIDCMWFVEVLEYGV